jgi:hypothetical protein
MCFIRVVRAETVTIRQFFQDAGEGIEGVNEMGDRTLPLLDRRGGRDIKKVAKHRKGADGVVVQMFCSSLNNHPVCAESGCFAIFFLWHSHPS